MSRQASLCAAMSLRSAGYPITASAPHSCSDFGEKRTHPSHLTCMRFSRLLRLRLASARAFVFAKTSGYQPVRPLAVRKREGGKR